MFCGVWPKISTRCTLRWPGGSTGTVQYTYDGFGNRIAVTVLQDSGAHQNLTIDPATNRIAAVSGFSYDANGNTITINGNTLAYDAADRLASFNNGGIPVLYGYNHLNKRIYKRTGSSEEYFLYGPYGELMGSYRMFPGPTWAQFERRWTHLYFAGRLIKAQDKWVVTDRQGSVRWRETNGAFAYYPYGEIRSGNGYAYATYLRDGATNLDYADQRYYQFNSARFLTADPYQGSAGPGNPGSWNRYAYVQGDPVNSNDPSGLLTIVLGGTSLPPWGRSEAEYALPGTPFGDAVSAYFEETPIVMEWRGQLWERHSAADTLYNHVKNHVFAEGETLNIVAFSHGGNVVKAYSNMRGARKIDFLVNLATPQRADYRIKSGMVGTYLNVYSKYDLTQKYGAGLSPYSATAGVIVGALKGGLGAIAGGVAGWIAGFSGRTDKCAVNIGIDWTAATGKVSHAELHTAAVWNAMEDWLVRAGHGSHPSGLSYCGSGGSPGGQLWGTGNKDFWSDESEYYY